MLGNILLSITVSNMPTGTVTIHKTDVGKMRRRASHWAKPIGTEMIRIVVTIPGADSNDRIMKSNTPRTANPRTFAETQTMRLLFR